MSEAGAVVRYQFRLEQVAAGFLIGAFQLVGRSHVGQFFGGGDTVWYFELRLWILSALSIWLFAVAATRSPRVNRYFAGRVRSWGVALVTFVAYMIATSLWAPDLTLAGTKTYDLLFVAWSCAFTVAALRLCGVTATIDGFWWAIFVLGLVLALAGLASALSGNLTEVRVSALGGGPNVFGRNMGLLSLAALHFIVDGRRFVRRPAFAVAPIAILLVLQSGSRGAMLALFAGMTVYLGSRRIDRRVLLATVGVGLVGLAALLTRVGQLAAAVFSRRFIDLLLLQGYTSHRVDLFTDGIAAGIENPLGGLGLAGFAQLGSFGTYPHNMFIEAFAEGGLLGLLLLTAPFVVYLRRWIHGRGPGHPAIIAGLCLLGISSSISGDLFDARGVFLLLLLSVATQLPAAARQHRSAGDTSALPVARA